MATKTVDAQPVISTLWDSRLGNLVFERGGAEAPILVAPGGAVGLVVARGGTYAKADGITTAINLVVWRANYAIRVTNVRGYRVGGSGATVNARRNASSQHLASHLSLTSDATWLDGGAVQNTDYAVGDLMEIMIVTASGSPTQIAIQVDAVRL